MAYNRDLDLTGYGENIFYEIVDDPMFKLGWDAPVQLIENKLKKCFRVPCFGDYLRRYIHKAQGISAGQGVYPLEYYIESIVASFNDSETPASFENSSTTVKNAAKNWLTRKSVSRKTVFLLGFGLKMSVDDVNELLTKALYEQSINPKDPFEVICWYCFTNGFNYLAYESLRDEYCKLPANGTLSTFDGNATSNIRNSMYAIASEEMLFSYLSTLKETENVSKFSQTAKKEFEKLYEKVEDIVGQDKHISSDKVVPADVEAYIYSGVPKTADGNLFKESMSDFEDIFVGKRLSRQRISQLISSKTDVTRFDLITLAFIVYANHNADSPIKRYSDFCVDINQILQKCSMQELIIQNPYENFVLCCLLTNEPMCIYWDVWENSFEADETV